MSIIIQGEPPKVKYWRRRSGDRRKSKTIGVILAMVCTFLCLLGVFGLGVSLGLSL